MPSTPTPNGGRASPRVDPLEKLKANKKASTPYDGLSEDEKQRLAIKLMNEDWAKKHPPTFQDTVIQDDYAVTDVGISAGEKKLNRLANDFFGTAPADDVKPKISSYVKAATIIDSFIAKGFTLPQAYEESLKANVAGFGNAKFDPKNDLFRDFSAVMSRRIQRLRCKKTEVPNHYLCAFEGNGVNYSANPKESAAAEAVLSKAEHWYKKNYLALMEKNDYAKEYGYCPTDKVELAKDIHRDCRENKSRMTKDEIIRNTGW